MRHPNTMPRHHNRPAVADTATGATDSTGAVDCAIIGGGVHGTYLSQRLLEDTTLDRDSIALIDPNDRLLDSFRRKARACGMDSLRSTFVNHLGTDPFALEGFAEGHDRDDELRPTVDYPDRPGLELFLDHANHVIDSKSLDTLHVQTTVTAISERAGRGVRVRTDDGAIDAQTCVLAIGHGGRFRLPKWAEGVDRVAHVWDGFDPSVDTERTVIIGGGITAAQLACQLTETEQVAMVTRHPLRWELSEADPPWLNWRHIERELHCHPPGSAARLAVIEEARYDATIPPHLYEPIECRLDDGRLQILQGEIATASSGTDGVELTFDDGLGLAADRVVCATGFEPVGNHPFVDRLADSLGLVRGARGLPVLSDETLDWRTADGRSLPLYVSGALAIGTVGPYAPNIPGARRAADRIVPAIDDRVRRPTTTKETMPTAD